jgi:hypothetical protein
MERRAGLDGRVSLTAQVPRRKPVWRCRLCIDLLVDMTLTCVNAPVAAISYQLPRARAPIAGGFIRLPAAG